MASEPVTREPEFNPYAAPTTELGGGALIDFYRTDSRRFTYGEVWRIAPNPFTFLVAALLKTLWIPLPRNFAIAHPHELTFVAWEDMPPHVVEKWRTRLSECQEAGLHRVFCHRLPCHGITREAIACILQSDDRCCSASLTYTRVENAATVKEVARMHIASRLEDGRRAITVDSRAYFDPPPDGIVQPVLGKSVAEMLQRHRDWIASLGATPVPRDPKDLPRVVLENEQQSIDHMVKRRAYVRITERELARVERSGRTETPPEWLNSAWYRLLVGAERVLFAVLLLTVAWGWIVPLRGPEPLGEALIRFALFLGSFAGFFLVKIIRFVLKRSRRSAS